MAFQKEQAKKPGEDDSWWSFVKVVTRYVLFCLAIVCEQSCYKQPPDVARLHEEVTPIIEALKHYKDSNGVYPTDMKSAGLTFPENKFGEWRYTLINTHECEVAIGDYEKDGIVVYWNSDIGWKTDG